MTRGPHFPRPRVAVIVPARDEEATIERCLRSLREQTYDGPIEVHVVDDGSTDGTGDVLARHPEVHALQGGGRGPSRARNMALAATDAPLVAFTDADCICDARWVESLVDALQRGGYAGVGGGQRSPDDECAFGRRVQAFLEAVGFVGDYVRRARRETPTGHNPSCNVAYRREVLQQVGGFDERLWPGEDVDLDLRLTRRGHRLAHTPEAVVYHYRPADLPAFARMMRSYGRAQGYLVRKHGPFRPLHALPALLLAGLPALPLLLWPPLLPVSGAAATALPWACFRLRGAPAREAALQVRLLHTTIAQWNLGFFEELLLGRMRRRGIA